MNLHLYLEHILPSFVLCDKYLIPLLSSTVAGAMGPDSRADELRMEQLTMTVEKVCIGAMGHPETGRNGALVPAVTNSLAWNVRAVVFTLYTSRREAVRWVH